MENCRLLLSKNGQSESLRLILSRFLRCVQDTEHITVVVVYYFTTPVAEY